MMDKQKLVDELRLALDNGDGDLDIIEQEIKNVIVGFYGSHVKDTGKFLGTQTFDMENINPIFRSALSSLINKPVSIECPSSRGYGDISPKSNVK
jgi:hypothetical protein